MGALLGQGGVVDHQHRVRPADEGIRRLDQDLPQGSVVPGGAGDEMMELVVAAEPEPGRGRLQALAVAGAEQAPHVDRRPPAPLLVRQPRQEWLQPAVESLIPCRTHHRSRPPE
jgi:hypothetical protein